MTNCANCTEYEQRIKELEHRIGALTYDNDYLKRGSADDALLIHTCGEIIDRVKKELGDYREMYFDSKKRIEQLEKMLSQLGE